MKRWALILSLLALCPSEALAQVTGRIVGTVVNESDRPLTGATVVVPGTRLGAVTGNDGRYAINNVPAGLRTVRVGVIGYATTVQQVALGAGEAATADFRLRIEAVLLEGLVVTGYGAQDRRDVTGAIVSVKSADMGRVPTSNPMKAVQGQLAGVDIVSGSYRPGASMSVRVRGVRSMVASNDALFVIDGVPISGGIEDFNPADVESIEVLKDASATAVYGSRGANGVVLMTTRSGSGEGIRFHYRTYAGWQRPINLVDMMNGAEFATYKREAWRVIGRDTSDAAVFPPQELASLRAGTWTDWQRAIVRTGLEKSHRLDVSGLSGTTRFSFSGNLLDQRGITINQSLDRASGTVSLHHQGGRVRVGATATITRSAAQIGRDDGLWDEALLNNPLGMPYDSVGILQWRPTADALRVNPLSEAAGWVRELRRDRVFSSTFMELDLLDGLQWRVLFGPDMSDRSDGEFRGPFTTARSGTLAEASRLVEETFAYTFDNLLQFSRDFGSDHRTGATLLHSVQKERYERTRAAAQNLPYDQQLWHNLGTGEIRSDVQSDLQEWALESFMGRLNYTLSNRYLLTLSARYDGSSRLAPGNHWAFFPSIGLGWHLGEEPFLRRLVVFTDLKLRGSYGRTGNTSISPYQTQGTLDRTRYSFGNTGAFGYRPSQIPNPELEWEKTDQLDIGIDFGVFGNRITGAIDYYRQDTRDLLMLRQLPFTSGFTQTLQNIGQTRNSGVEIDLSSLNLDGWHGIRWSTDLNLSHNRNQIVGLYGTRQDDPGNSWFVGHPIDVPGDRLRRVFYDFRFAGIWQQSEVAEAARYGQRPGDIKVEDINRDGVINASDRVIIGDSYPKWTVGLSTRMTWRNLELSMLGTARMGYTIRDNFGIRHNGLYGRYNNLDVDYWTPANPSNRNPRPNAGREDPLYTTSRAYMDGSHARIRNLTLTYELPQALVRLGRAASMSIYFGAQEPFVFTSYHGYDPEGGDVATPPSYRTFLFGTDVTF